MVFVISSNVVFGCLNNYFSYGVLDGLKVPQKMNKETNQQLLSINTLLQSQWQSSFEYPMSEG